MKHFLLLLVALANFYPLVAINKSSEVITNPSGVRKTYSQACRNATDNSGQLWWTYAKRNEIVWGEGNTEVYFRNPLNLIDIPHDFYIKGHTVGNQVIIALPQLISTSGETDKYIWIMRYDSTSKTYVKDTEKSSVTFDIDSDGTLRLADQSELLALGDKNGNWLKPNSIPELRTPTVISSVTYSPVNTNPILPPADAKIESWWMTFLMKEGLSHDTSVNVAITDDSFYIQGVSVQHPNAWIKGAILHNSNSFQVSFAQSQYVGWDENSNELSFFYGYTYTPAIDELTGRRIQEDIKLWETKTPIVLDYNPQAKTLSAHEGEGFTINNGIGITNMWESFGYMTFSRSGKVFVAKVPWTTTEIDMTFKVVDEDEKKCQVGNGHIPVSPEDLEGQAIYDFYSGEIAVPETVNGYQVVRVGYGAFEEMPKLTNVVLPDAVTQIDRNAFRKTTAMTSFSFPPSLRKIEDYAFLSSGITAIEIASVKELGISVFSRCHNLSEIVWPGHLATIPESTFEECNNLKKVIVTDGVHTIDKLAFAFCNSLKEIDIAHVNTLKTIGQFAFKNTAVETLTIPANVEQIGKSAFSGMQKVKSITVLSDTPAAVEAEPEGSLSFDINKECILYVPKGSLNAYATADGWKEFLQLGGIKEVEFSGISSLEADSKQKKDTGWYTIDGKQLTGRPNQPGIYIYGHKKIIVTD